MADLKVSVVSADNEVWSGLAKQIVARTTEGEIGILPGHEPILAILAAGEIRVTNLEDGFLSVEHDTVTIVARNAALV